MKLKFSTLILLITFLLKINSLSAQLDKMKIIKNVNYNDKLVSKSGADPLYRMTIGFNDIDGNYHQLPQKFMCEDNEAIYRPCIYFDSLNYFIFAKSLDETFNGYVYKYNAKEGFKKEIVFTNQAMGYVPFFGKLTNGEPSLYYFDKNATTKQIVKSSRTNGNWTSTNVDLELSTYLDLNDFISQKQWYKDSYKQFPFKIFDWRSYEAYKPIWCKTDDLLNAKEKPTELYDEIANTKFEIPNMPWIEEQSELGECEAYAFGALFQQWVCTKWKGTEDEIKDCKNPPLESKVSYFGILSKIHRNKNDKFVLAYDDPKFKDDENEGIRYRADRFLRNPFRTIRDSSKPFQNISYALSHNGNIALKPKETIKKKDNFLLFLNRLYDNQKMRTNTKSILDSLFFYTGMEAKYFNLEKAFSKLTYEDFTESLFFDNCQYGVFPLGASIIPYPIDITRKEITYDDLKQKIIEILTIKKKPLLFSSAIGIQINGETRDGLSHQAVICGYKKVKNSRTNEVIELFKIHNSWGEKWQKENNSGWCNAKNLVESISLMIDEIDGKPYFSSATIQFLD
jgi:hypothetical protein